MAELAAREMGSLGLQEALSLVCLYAVAGDAKFEPAAVRWLVRLAQERRLTLAEIQLASAALGALRPEPERALRILQEVSQ